LKFDEIIVLASCLSTDRYWCIGCILGYCQLAETCRRHPICFQLPNHVWSWA